MSDDIVRTHGDDAEEQHSLQVDDMTHVGLTTVEITPMVRLGPHVGRSPPRRKRLQAAYMVLMAQT